MSAYTSLSRGSAQPQCLTTCVCIDTKLLLHNSTLPVFIVTVTDLARQSRATHEGARGSWGNRDKTLHLPNCDYAHVSLCKLVGPICVFPACVTDAEWPEALLLHKSTCLDTAATLDAKRRRRQERWQAHMQRSHAANSRGPPGPDGPSANALGGLGSPAAGDTGEGGNMECTAITR
jgi:hypothetical protein